MSKSQFSKMPNKKSIATTETVSKKESTNIYI